MAQFGEDIYGTINDDLNELNNDAHAAKDAYDTGKDIYNGAKDLYHNIQDKLNGAQEAGAAAEGAADIGAGGEAAAEAVGLGEAATGTAEAATAGAGAGAAAGGAAATTGAAAGGAAATGTAAGGAAAVAASPILIPIGIVVGILCVFLLFVAYYQTMGQSSSGRTYYESTQSQQNTKNYSGSYESGKNDDKPDDDPDYEELYERYGGSPYLKGYFQFIPFLKGSEKVIEDAEGSQTLEGTIKAMQEEKGFPNSVGAFEKAKKLALLDAQAWVDNYHSMSGLIGNDKCIHDGSHGAITESDYCSHGDIPSLGSTIDGVPYTGCDGWTNESSQEVMDQIETAVETLFDDVDYAELLCVLGENEDFDLNNMTEEGFRAIFMGKKSTRTSVLREYYYLEIRVQHSMYDVTYTYENDNGDPETVVTEKRSRDVGVVTLERYNLDELYVICGQRNAFESWEKHEDFNPDSTHYMKKFMTNAEFLEWQEPLTRRYGAYGQATTDGNYINTETQNKLFGEKKRSQRGEIRGRQGFDIANFEYYASETLDNLISSIHGFFSGTDETTTSGGYIENSKNKKILNMYRYINQADEPQASISFAGGTYHQYGCAPSCYIMVAEYYLRQEQNIQTLVNKYSAGSSGIYGAALISGLGGQSYEHSYSGEDMIISEIDSGNPVILSFKGNAGALGNHPNGHYIVIMGYDEHGFYVYDPGDRYNTYGHGGPSECLITYEEFASISNTFRSVYTFSFPNAVLPDLVTDSTFDVDENTVATVKQALSFLGTSNTAYAMEYAYLTEKYGSNFAIGFMANMMQESSGRGGVSQNDGSIIKSGSDIQKLIDDYNSGVHTWSGLGIHQWTESRKAGLLQQYQEDGLLEKDSVSQEELIASELKYLAKELEGSESGVVSSCEGKSYSECTKIIAKQFERCGTYGSRNDDATKMYQALQRAGVVS